MRRTPPSLARDGAAHGSWSAHALVRDMARSRGGDPAIVAGATRLTWMQLDLAVDRAADRLRASGLSPGGRLALGVDPVAWALPLLLGAHRLGAGVALLPSGMTPVELGAALDLLAPDLVVAESAVRDAALPLGSGPARTNAGPPATPGAGPAGPDLVAPSDPAVVVLTSGTTGRAKGVILSHRALAASADAWLAALPAASGWLLCVGLSHVAGLGVVWRAIRAGVPIITAPPGDPVTQLAALRGSAGGPPVSHVSLVPVQLLRLLDATGPEPAPVSLRAVLLGGGTIPPALVERAVAPGWPVIPTYGLSEAGSGVTALPATEAARRPGSAGRPLPGTTVSIDRPDNDGVGEIVVTSPAAFSGYAGEEPRGPVEPIRTGDLGRLDSQGRLQVLERRVDRIVRGGENISPAEVESVLMAHPGIDEAAVVARPNPAWGGVPVAALVTTSRRAPDQAELAAWCRERLAGFKVPEVFLRLDALPRTSSGKLRREALRDLVDGSTSGILARPGGDWIGWRVTGADAPAGRPNILLFPGTLSNARQLDRLAAELAGAGAAAVHALDRRGSGTSRLGAPGPVDIAVHVDDIRAYLDARGIAAAVVLGHSYGGALAIEASARLPDRVRAVIAYEPPYRPLADDATLRRFATTGRRTREAYQRGGRALAAEVFLRLVAGDPAWEQLSERGRSFVIREGDAALTDSAMLGMEASNLPAIEAPVRILTGGAGLPFYPVLAAAIVEAIPRASHVILPDLTHNGPITDPVPVAAAVRDFLAGVGAALVGHSTEPRP